MKTILVIFLAFLPLICSAKRTISGKITDKNGNPIRNARVRAYDSDFGSSDDLMKTVYTDNNGRYTLTFEGKHWDPAPHWWTIWCPDIYIWVSIRVNGRCDDGEWNSSANWKRIGQSRPVKTKLQNEKRSYN